MDKENLDYRVEQSVGTYILLYANNNGKQGNVTREAGVVMDII